MKKFLLSLSAFFGVALAAQAAIMPGKALNNSVTYPSDNNLSAICLRESMPALESSFKAPAKAEGEAPYISYTYAGEPYGATGFNTAEEGLKVVQMIKMPKADASIYVGNQVTKFQFYTGVRNGSSMNYVKNYTFFIKESMYGDPVYEQQYVVPNNLPYELQTVELTTPFTLESGKDYFFGCYAAILNYADLTIVFDYTNNIEDGSIIGYESATGWKYQYLSDAGLGSNCIAVQIQGENLPENLVSLDDYNIIPVQIINKPFQIGALITNRAANAVNSVELTYTLGEGEPVSTEITLEAPIANGEEAAVYTPEMTYSTVSEDVPFTVTVTKVNGVENAYTNNSAEGTIDFLETAFTKNVVVEEFTGTWCGWCPRGIVAFETLNELYPDGSFIPVAVHIGSDPMKAKSWADMISLYSDGSAPASVINRTYASDPSTANLMFFYQYMHGYPALAEIGSITAQWSDDSYSGLDVKVTSRFALDYASACPYTLQFAVLENGVGPYNQTNNYAGGSNGDMGGWGSKGASVKTVYNHVARYLNGFPMIEGSVPASVEKGKDYEYTQTLDISKSMCNIKNRDNEHLDLVVYIINITTGRIENALRLDGENFEAPTKTGINEIVTDSNAPVEYYNLQGARVGSDAKGLVIRKQGDKVEKVIL